MFTKNSGTGILIAKLRAIADALESKEALLIEVDIHEQGNASEPPETAISFKVVSVETRVKVAMETVPKWQQLMDIHFRPEENGISRISDTVREEAWRAVVIIGDPDKPKYIANKKDGNIHACYCYESLNRSEIEEEYILFKLAYSGSNSNRAAWRVVKRSNMDVAICVTKAGAQEFLMSGKK